MKIDCAVCSMHSWLPSKSNLLTIWPARKFMSHVRPIPGACCGGGTSCVMKLWRNLWVLWVRHCWVGCPAVSHFFSAFLVWFQDLYCSKIAICGKNWTAGLPGTLIVRRLWPFQMFPPTDFVSRLELQESPQKNRSNHDSLILSTFKLSSQSWE